MVADPKMLSFLPFNKCNFHYLSICGPWFWPNRFVSKTVKQDVYLILSKLLFYFPSVYIVVNVEKERRKETCYKKKLIISRFMFIKLMLTVQHVLYALIFATVLS